MKMTESQKSPRRRGVFAVTPCKWEVQGRRATIGQALGYADVLATAFSHAMTYRPEDPEWGGADRFLLSHGHYAIAYYAALLEAGIIPEAELETAAPTTAACPRMSGMATYTRGWRCPAARWGRGCPLPSAMALRLQQKQSKAWVYNSMSDGGLDEGSTWEAAISAAHYGAGAT